jgi:hypothetical protein
MVNPAVFFKKSKPSFIPIWFNPDKVLTIRKYPDTITTSRNISCKKIGTMRLSRQTGVEVFILSVHLGLKKLVCKNTPADLSFLLFTLF